MSTASSTRTTWSSSISTVSSFSAMSRSTAPSRRLTGLITGGPPVAYATNNASRRAADVADLLVVNRHRAPDRPRWSRRRRRRRGCWRSGCTPVTRCSSSVARRCSAEITDVGLTPVSVGGRQAARGRPGVRAGRRLDAARRGLRRDPGRRDLGRDERRPHAAVAAGRAARATARWWRRLATALDRQPDVIVGKPAPALFQRRRTKVAAARPLVVGDRLDTDIAGAVQARDGLDARADRRSDPGRPARGAGEPRPTWVAPDLRGLTGGAVRVPTVASNGVDGR